MAKTNKKNSPQVKGKKTNSAPLDKRLTNDPIEQREIHKLLKADSPEKYIDLATKSSLKSSLKGIVTRHWLKQRNFSVRDLTYARNRHPHWKSKKQINHAERTRQRFQSFNYSQGQAKNWTAEELRRFLELNEQASDRELAEKFQRSIPSVQGIRRRINLAKKILTLKGIKRIQKKSLRKYIIMDEKILRRIFKETKEGS